MKKLLIVLAVVLTVLVISSCATQSNGTQGFVSTGTVTMAKRAEASNTVWFGAFGGNDYPPYDLVAKENGITRIATVERFRKLGVFGLWTIYTTVITGE